MTPEVFRPDQGSVLLATMVVLTIGFALAGGASLLTSVELDATTESNERMQAFYIADSGAQIGTFLMRSDSARWADSTFVEKLSGGSTSVNITTVGGGLYQISSTGNYLGETARIEVFVSLKGGFNLRGAVEMSIDDGMEIKDTNGVPIDILGSSTISGLDHDKDGGLLADQSGAVPGLGMNPVPGDEDFSLTVGVSASLEGSPTATVNDLEQNASYFQTILTYARSNADVSISVGRRNTRTLGSADTGSYGTAAAPALVYVRMDDESTLSLSQNFSGYGTLVLDMVDEVDENVALRLQDNASWHGLILMQFHDETEIEGGSVVLLQGSSKIVGGLAMHFWAVEAGMEEGGQMIRTQDSSSILYSSELLGSAPGTSSVAGSPTMSVASYRVY